MTANEIGGILFFTFSPPFKAGGWGYSSSSVYIAVVMVARRRVAPLSLVGGYLVVMDAAMSS